jgi:hypothetical protein
VTESLAHRQTALLRAEATRARAEHADLVLVNRAEVARFERDSRYDSRRPARERAVLAADKRASELEQLASDAESALQRMAARPQSRKRRKSPAAGVTS